ncbi:MAG: type II toxin-antitoxin system RelE/ParE family toxin [Robiginitomaculum sp.]|nr:type II toxin-antitoxin system RelE/ParE family toxin [Robiginitomaculum sp.]
MKYKLSLRAEDDIREMFRYGLQEYGIAKADEYFDELHTRFDLLSEHPSWGANYGHITPNLKRYEHKAHSIYYTYFDEDILIVRVLGNKQDPARHV